MNLKQLKLTANTIRQDIVSMVANAQSGHPGGALGLADIFTALYFKVLNHNPKKPNWSGRDRLIMSNGHACPVRYAAMARSGYFPVSELMSFRKIGSKLQGHPSINDLRGVESSSGSLGQGLSIAVGMALADKLDNKTRRVYAVISEGDLDEGSTWEAINAAAKFKLDNLIVIVDRNNIQISGSTETVWPLGYLQRKFTSFGWTAYNVNGNDISAVLKIYTLAKKTKDKPTIIIAKTILGKGISFMENNPVWHGKAPDNHELLKAVFELRDTRKIIRRSP